MERTTEWRGGNLSALEKQTMTVNVNDEVGATDQVEARRLQQRQQQRCFDVVRNAVEFLLKALRTHVLVESDNPSIG
jgi:hypothetical protein